MVVYYFNPKVVKELYKLKVLKVRSHWGGTMQCFVDPKTDPRKDYYKDWISVSTTEGKVRYSCFWLAEEDDKRAQEIHRNYIENKIEEAKKEINRLKEKYGVD